MNEIQYVFKVEAVPIDGARTKVGAAQTVVETVMLKRVGEVIPQEIINNIVLELDRFMQERGAK